MDGILQLYFDELKALKKLINANASDRIGKVTLRREAERLGEQWFKILPELEQRGIGTEELLAKYSENAARLIKLSAPNNWKSSYVAVLSALTKSARNELILPIKSNKPSKPATVFETFVSEIEDPEESAYFHEAVKCAKHGFLRAAAVMAWCAAIDRIHRKIDAIGFGAFNVASAQMASQQQGRYKRFNQTQNVTSMSDLRQVFDTTVLWVVEGMGLIDLNQHTRLRSCFEMRNHSAHPGEAPVTEYNLMSFFSDIQQIVINNQKFKI